MPTTWKSRENAYDVRFHDGRRERTEKVGYLSPITDADRAQLPILLGQSLRLTDVRVLDVTPA